MAKVILIVEDDHRNLKLLKDLLRVSGYETIEATEGREAILMAHKRRPDLILMDIQLPDTDGLLVSRILKRTRGTSAIPIVAVTACAMEGDEQKAREAGCDGYMTKPIHVLKFLNTVDDYVGPACQKRGAA